MELKNFYRLVFTNSQEYFVESDISEMEKFKSALTKSGFVSREDYISLQLGGGDPLYIKSDKLFSIQRAREGIVGAQTKLWKLS